MSAVPQRTTFKTSRLLEFCSRKELVAQTGVAPSAWPVMIIKELVDNALDACEEASIAPVLHVTVAGGKIRVRDNGPGVPPATVASITDFSTRTSSREAYVAPDRGWQGNALKTVLAVPFTLGGDEGRVEIAARGVRHEITFRVDRIAQRPVIEHRQHRLDGASVRTGTSVTVHWPESARSDLEDAEGDFLPIVTRFTDFNPHLSLTATWVCGGLRRQWTGAAVDPGWVKWVPSAPTCPHWYRVADLERLAGAFLSHDRERRTVRLLRDFLGEFNGLSGTAKRKAVLEAVGLQRAPLERLLQDGEDFDHGLVGRLLEAMQAAARPVRPDRLGPIGGDNVAEVLDLYRADPSTIRCKQLKGVENGVPWVAEAAFGYRPDDLGRLLLCGVNWSPSLDIAGDPFRLGTLLGESYCGAGEPIVLLAHLICPRPEFLDRGKTNLADYSPGYRTLKAAVADVVAPWAKQRRGEIRDRSREQKRLERLQRQRAPETSLKDAVLRHLPGAIATTSGGGSLSFTQRDLFYVVRPLVQQAQDKSLSYGYFTQLLTDHEYEHGEIPGLQREPRGSLYHPHLQEEIPLSTETFARYARPFWTFNKLVYIEKAGTQKNLIEVGWPEEHDCAIASVAGFTTRAIKDLLDMLATSTEPITVFCVHDADAAGTMIYHTLVNETKARGARKIEIVNLGLEPWEGVEKGLEVEDVEGTDKRRAVAPYVAEHDAAWLRWLLGRGVTSWSEWLQKHRIELNAMQPADRVAWLTKKIETYPPRMVVPPPPLLHAARVGAARTTIHQELERRARIAEHTDKILTKIKWPDQENLPKVVTRFLDHERHRKASWHRPMSITGAKHAKRVLKP
jgi:Histidine kinase-, DNA gyrase B-, and HSP90-like ATPase